MEDLIPDYCGKPSEYVGTHKLQGLSHSFENSMVALQPGDNPESHPVYRKITPLIHEKPSKLIEMRDDTSLSREVRDEAALALSILKGGHTAVPSNLSEVMAKIRAAQVEYLNS